MAKNLIPEYDACVQNASNFPPAQMWNEIIKCGTPYIFPSRDECRLMSTGDTIPRLFNCVPTSTPQSYNSLIDNYSPYPGYQRMSDGKYCKAEPMGPIDGSKPLQFNIVCKDALPNRPSGYDPYKLIKYSK
jgi:hypothetical protein